MAIIHITDLHLRTVVGTYEWERKVKQDVILNITLEFNAKKAAKSDKIKDTVDYKGLTKNIIRKVESSKYFLIEKLAAQILNIIMKTPGVEEATVRIDKPGALRFARSVSVTLTSKDNE